MKGWKAIVWRKMGVLIFSVPDPTSHIRLRFLSSRRHPLLQQNSLVDINIKSVCKNVFNFPPAKRSSHTGALVALQPLLAHNLQQQQAVFSGTPHTRPFSFLLWPKETFATESERVVRCKPRIAAWYPVKCVFKLHTELISFQKRSFNIFANLLKILKVLQGSNSFS